MAMAVAGWPSSRRAAEPTENVPTTSDTATAIAKIVLMNPMSECLKSDKKM